MIYIILIFIFLILIGYYLVSNTPRPNTIIKHTNYESIPLDNLISLLRIYHIDQSYKFNLNNLPTKSESPNNSSLSPYQKIHIEGIKNDIETWTDAIRNDTQNINLLVNDIKLNFINYTDEEAIVFTTVYINVNNKNMILDAKYYVKIYKGYTITEEDEYNYQLFDVRRHTNYNYSNPNPFPNMDKLVNASKYRNEF